MVRLEIRSGVENTDDNWSAYQTEAIDYQMWRSRRYATTNDDADPDTINWAWIYPRADSHWHILDKGNGDKRLYAEGINRTLDGREIRRIYEVLVAQWIPSEGRKPRQG